MSLTFDEIEQIIKNKVSNKEELSVRDINELAEQSEDLNFIQINMLYATILEDFKKSEMGEPTKKEAIETIWQEISKQNLKPDHAVIIQDIIHNIELQDRFGADLIDISFTTLIQKGWLHKASESVLIMTELGYENR